MNHSRFVVVFNHIEEFISTNGVKTLSQQATHTRLSGSFLKTITLNLTDKILASF